MAADARGPATGPISTVDYHTAGEPFRIVLDGAPELPGATVRERREHALRDPEVQAFRELLCNEPRGHADMYGGLITPADDEGARFGVLFWHREGFSTACGHGTIALGVWAIEQGIVPADGEETAIPIDVPSGRVVARVRSADGLPRSVVFRNVPSYVAARAVPIDVDGVEVEIDLAFSGTFYASLPAARLGLEVSPTQLRALISAATRIKRELEGLGLARHPVDDRLSGVYGVIFHDELGASAGAEVNQRNVTVFADGEVDRSPCGSGTSARLALLHDEGRLGLGETLRHESIVGSSFMARVAEEAAAEDGRPAVITEVEGMAHKTGEHRFSLDPRDPLGTGFLLA